MIVRKFYIYCSNKNHELTSKTRGDMAKQKLDMYLPKATSFMFFASQVSCIMYIFPGIRKHELCIADLLFPSSLFQ